MSEQNFATFYQLYPRKMKRAEAQVMWNRLKTDERILALAAIPKHIAYWEAQGTEKHYIPLPSSWLNPVLGRRWEDEIEIEQPRQKVQQIAWWTSEAGCIAKGLEVGISPYPGEDMAQFKGRINTRIKVSA